ncbi:MAG TPA: hypothetical protein ENH40_05300 [Nitrospirae bacterium]|nr:hypothetical protein [Nitrospirota bacterium]
MTIDNKKPLKAKQIENENGYRHSPASIGYNSVLFDERLLVWFSCGAASAVAAKRVIEQYGNTHDIEVVYCDTLEYEHPDNIRFLSDVAGWIGRDIKIIKSRKYNDILCMAII